MPSDTDKLIGRLVGGDEDVDREILDEATTATSPTLLVAAALIGPAHETLLERAARSAATTRDRQLVAVARAHLDGDAELLDALVRDHLADHPDNILAAWIAARPIPSHQPRSILLTSTTAPVAQYSERFRTAAR